MADRPAPGQGPPPVAEEAVLVRQGIGAGRLHRADAGGGEARGAVAGQVELPAVLAPAGGEVAGIGGVAGQHGIAVAEVDEQGWREGEGPRADAMVTRRPGIALGIVTADCAPVLLADHEAGVVGAAHAGWKGALGGVIAAVVDAMASLGARPERIVAVVGPCIAQSSYEVGTDFEARFVEDAPAAAHFFAPGEALDKRLFDLPGYVLWRLEQAGVGEAAWTGHDTCEDAGRFFSNRRAFRAGEPDFGRMMSAISL